MSHSGYEAVIGLEVHAQLATRSKIFCGCRAKLDDGRSVADITPNTNTCPICAGHPGTLPVLNEMAVEFAVRAGLATHCRINSPNVFARKNYFYPDLPKGYQISQLESPICEGGFLMIRTGQGDSAVEKKIRIERIHMEEDAGKNVHLSGYSLVNLNRAGVPLIEIVSHPDLRTPEEAGAYLRALHGVVTYLGVCDGNMQEGNFRCDANVSVRPVGAAKLGTRAEVKNVNSFKFVEKAIEYEINRQIEVIQAGGRVVQETRGFDSQRGVTVSQRSKEEAQDYRYFPDPDLITVQLTQAQIARIQSEIPELPEQKRSRYLSEFGLSEQDADALIATQPVAEFFEQSLGAIRNLKGSSLQAMAKQAANLLTGEVTRLANVAGVTVKDGKLKPDHLAQIVGLVAEQVVSSTGAKQILSRIWESGDEVAVVVEKQGLRQVSDSGALVAEVNKVVAAFPDQVAEYRSGKEKVMGFFVGQVMKGTGGKANPSVLQELLKKALKSS